MLYHVSEEAGIERFEPRLAAGLTHPVVWLDRIRRTKLYCYRLPEATFHCVDVCAGYFHSNHAVVPKSVEVIKDLLAALADCDVEIRILPSLWQLHDAVVASTLSYSMIRMRNAKPR